MTTYDRIVYIINGGRYGNGYIGFTKWKGFGGNIEWITSGASCGLHKKSIDEIKKEQGQYGKTKFVIVKLTSLPKQ